jgi:predicted DNA-binding protein
MKTNTKFYQFPLRINRTLAELLESTSETTGINKTALIRISIEKFILELNQSGIPQAMQIIKTQSFK